MCHAAMLQVDPVLSEACRVGSRTVLCCTACRLTAPGGPQPVESSSGSPAKGKEKPCESAATLHSYTLRNPVHATIH
jgi:hypothetical protein